MLMMQIDKMSVAQQPWEWIKWTTCFFVRSRRTFVLIMLSLAKYIDRKITMITLRFCEITQIPPATLTITKNLPCRGC